MGRNPADDSCRFELLILVVRLRGRAGGNRPVLLEQWAAAGGPAAGRTAPRSPRRWRLENGGGALVSALGFFGSRVAWPPSRCRRLPPAPVLCPSPIGPSPFA